MSAAQSYQAVDVAGVCGGCSGDGNGACYNTIRTRTRLIVSADPGSSSPAIHAGCCCPQRGAAAENGVRARKLSRRRNSHMQWSRLQRRCSPGWAPWWCHRRRGLRRRRRAPRTARAPVGIVSALVRVAQKDAACGDGRATWPCVVAPA